MCAKPTFIAFSEYLVTGYSDESVLFDADVTITFMVSEFHSPNS